MAEIRYPSPCLVCKRVRNPKACNNKNCEEWRQWFTGRWEQTRRQVRAGLDRIPQVPAGVSIGGHRYIPPHRMREYLQIDPCARCSCYAHCTASCQARRTWDRIRKEVYQ